MAQHQQQFDMEMQQQQQQQGVGGQPSPNPYGSPSIAPAAPGTPNKMPRVAPPPAASAVSMVSCLGGKSVGRAGFESQCTSTRGRRHETH